MTTPDERTILVTGDWVADWNLARPQNLPDDYSDSSNETQLHHRAGGAWYVTHLIEHVVCRDLTGPAGSAGTKLQVKPLRDPVDATAGLDANGKPNSTLAHAYSIWSKHRKLASDKKEGGVWRIAQFAGCRKSTCWTPPSVHPRRPAASLLVIDDLGLGFSDQPSAVAHVISHAGDGARILLKHGLRSDGTGILAILLGQKLGPRLHVVAAAGALRRRNAALSQALSWDHVLEDIEAEFKSGPSSRDLALCETAVVHFGSAGAAVFRRGKLHRMYFLPDEMEHDWELERPGSSFGTGSILTACVARHLLWPEDYPLFFAVTQALAAQQVAHEEGAGSGDEPEIDLPYGPRGKAADPDKHPAAACIAPPPQPAERKPGEPEPKEPRCVEAVKRFRAAWNPEEIDVWPRAQSPGLQRCRLLTNVTGTSAESLAAKAAEVVVQGVSAALASVPKAVYGRYVTIDRGEIESINEIRRLILEYQKNPTDKRPLSVAVLGAPGSGKSFAIKEVGKAIFGKDKEPMEFNLTQFKSPDDLHRAFHQVRDASIRREIPLVFWDEFDAGDLKWLADFLGPMQDAEFFDGSHKHPFGKCIFVFAGGTCSSFDGFRHWKLPGDESKPTPQDPWHLSFKAVKGPDFISRLRGFIDVKGPNPESPSENTPPGGPSSQPGPSGDSQDGTARALDASESSDSERCPGASRLPGSPTEAGGPTAPPVVTTGPESPDPDATHKERIAHDPAYVLRRALILRSEIERNFPGLLDPETKRADIAPNVLQAFLHLKSYKHGARSLAALLTMSALTNARSFRISALPSSRLRSLHLSRDFVRLLLDPAWSEDLILALAEVGWRGWMGAKQHSPDKTEAQLHGDLRAAWAELSASAKLDNLDPVPRRLLELQRLGYLIVPHPPGSGCIPLTAQEISGVVEEMIDPEHRIWLSRRLAEGWELGSGQQPRRHLRQHPDIKAFQDLEESQKALNRGIITATLEAFGPAGYCLVRKPPEKSTTEEADRTG